jgi:hypothetical protein
MCFSAARFTHRLGVAAAVLIPLAMVGLLNALPETQLWRRLEREGRLLGEATGNNTVCSLNFKTRLDLAFLIQGYQTLMRTIYSPREYYDRVFYPCGGLPRRLPNRTTTTLSPASCHFRDCYLD